MDKLDLIKLVIGTSGGFWAAFKGVPATIRFGKRVLDAIDTIQVISEQFKNNGGSSLKDTTDRLESLMIVERERNRAVSTLMPAGMFETDRYGFTTWVSSKYTDITGAALADAEGMNWVTQIHEDDRTRILAEWRDAVTNERRSVASYRLLTDLGERRIIVETFPVHNRDKFLGHIGLVCLLG